MCLAESLLRVPDAATADRLIRDKIGSGHWDRHLNKSHSLFVNASTFALMLTGRVVTLDEASTLGFRGHLEEAGRALGRAGDPPGRDLCHAHSGRPVRARPHHRRSAQARQAADRGRLPLLLRHAGRGRLHRRRMPRAITRPIRRRLRRSPKTYPDLETEVFERPSISVKLSALHPRYEWVKRERVMTELLPRLVALGDGGARGQSRPHHRRRRGRTPRSHARCLRSHGRERRSRRLGRAGPRDPGLCQARAAADRLACRSRPPPAPAHSGASRQGRLLGHRDQARRRRRASPTIPSSRANAAPTPPISPARAPCSAKRTRSIRNSRPTTRIRLSAIQVLAGTRRDFEYQRLHGMGEMLYELYREVKPPHRVGAGTRIYAPVGSHEDLLAYLVRRLLENGANTSFVNRLADEEVPDRGHHRRSGGGAGRAHAAAQSEDREARGHLARPQEFRPASSGAIPKSPSPC